MFLIACGIETSSPPIAFATERLFPEAVKNKILIVSTHFQNNYKALSKYFHFIQMFKKLGFYDVVSFLENAMSGVFHDEKDRNNRKKYTSNSLIEREMREINRRTDIGVDGQMKVYTK